MKIISIIFSLVFLITPHFVFASNLFFQSEIKKVKSGDEFKVELFINSQKDYVNAIEGKINFSNDNLELKEVISGNSIINFWLEKPRIENKQIFFSGITPGGFSGDGLYLFSFILQAKKDGVVNFSINDLKVLRNDGEASIIDAYVYPYQIEVNSLVEGNVLQEEPVDSFPPEVFTPELSKSDVIYNGKWFVTFYTQDKNSGVSYYEVKESRSKLFSFLKFWRKSEGSIVLNDQELKSYIFVKAVDTSGNERVAIIKPSFALNWYEKIEIWVIIIVSLIILSLFIKHLWKIKK